MIIDAHSHLGEFNNHSRTPEELVASMQEAGIDHAILLANDRVTRKGLTTKEAIEISQKHPQFKPVGNIDSSDINPNQIKKLTDYLGENKIYGVKLYAGYDNYYWFDERLDPLYEYCQKNNKPVAFHTGVLASESAGLLKQSHPLNADEVANRFPKLKIVLCHIGNPWIMDCAAVVAKNENVYVDLSGYFGEFSKIKPIEIEMFKRVMSDYKMFVGDFKKCLFGTDYPLYNQKEYLEAIESLEMTDEEKELVFWKNANSVYNLGL